MRRQCNDRQECACISPDQATSLVVFGQRLPWFSNKQHPYRLRPFENHVAMVEQSRQSLLCTDQFNQVMTLGLIKPPTAITRHVDQHMDGVDRPRGRSRPMLQIKTQIGRPYFAASACLPQEGS